MRFSWSHRRRYSSRASTAWEVRRLMASADSFAWVSAVVGAGWGDTERGVDENERGKGADAFGVPGESTGRLVRGVLGGLVGSCAVVRTGSTFRGKDDPGVVGGVRGLWSPEGTDWKIESVVNGERGRREGNVVPRVSVRS